MKTICLLIATVLAALTSISRADPVRIVIDPIADYTFRHKDDLRAENERDEHIVKIEIDLDNDGKKDLFLSREKSCVLDKIYENKVFTWDFYRKLEDGRFAVIENEKSKNEDGSFRFHKSEFAFDPSKLFLGYIAQIKTYGMLVVYYLPKHNGVALSVYVYRGDCFEQLNFPEPTKPVKIYHRDDAGNIPDLPEALRSYLANPPQKKMEVVP